MTHETVSTTSSSPISRVFLSSWKRASIGTSERLRLSLGPQGTVNAQTLVQGLRGKFASFLNGNNPDIGTYVTNERTFNQVTRDQFQRERDKLNQLDQSHKTVAEMLRELETDFAAPAPSASSTSTPQQTGNPARMAELAQQMETVQRTMDGLNAPTAEPEPTPARPSLSREETAERHATVEDLRQKLSTLLSEIQSEERTCQGFGKLLTSIQRVKTAAQNALNETQQLDARADHPEVTGESLRSDAQRLARSSEQWQNDLADARQALVEEAALQSKATTATAKMKFFSQDIQDSWQTYLTEWKANADTQVGTLEQAREHGRTLDGLLVSMTDRCKREIVEELQSAKAGFTREIDKAPSAKLNEQQRAQVDRMRSEIKAMHLQMLDALENEKDRLGNNLNAIIEWSKKAKGTWASGKVLTTFLNKEFSYTFKDRFWEFFNGYLTNNSDESEVFDETIVENIQSVMCEIGAAALAILETISVDEQSFFTNHFQRLVERRGIVSQNELEALLNKFTAQVASQDPAQIQQEACQQVKHLYECLKIFLKCHESQRTAQLEKFEQLRSEVTGISNHPSLNEFCQSALTKLRTQTAWNPDEDLGILNRFWKMARKDFDEAAQLFASLKTLATVQNKYIGLAATYTQKIASMTGTEQISAQRALDILKGSIDFRHSSDEEKGVWGRFTEWRNSKKSSLDEKSVDKAFVQSYKVRLESQDLEILALLDIEEKKEDVRRSMKDEIDGFVQELAAYKGKLSSLESAVHLQFPQMHTKLSQMEQEVKLWKEKGTIKKGYFDTKAIEVNVKDLSLELLTTYQTTLKDVLSAERAFLLHESGIPSAHDAYATFKQDVKNVEDRIKELKSENLLQIKHSEDLTAKLAAQIRAFEEEIKKHPTLDGIESACKHMHHKLTRLAQQYREIENMPLLEQMRRFEGNAEKVHQLRQFFLRQEAAKINAKVTEWKSKLETLRELPILYTEASAKMKAAIQDLESRLNVFPTFLGRCASLNPFAEQKLLSLTGLNRYDLSNYKRSVDACINKGQAQMDKFNAVLVKVRKANSKFDDKITEITTKIHQLEQNNQFLFSDKLSALIKTLKEERKTFQESLGVGTTTFFCWKRNTPLSTSQYLEEYTKQVGGWVGRADQLLMEVNKSQNSSPLTIPEQLEMSPGAETEKRLRARYEQVVSQICQNCENALTTRKRDLRDSLAYYVPERSPLFRDIERSIDKKLKLIEAYKKEFDTGGFFGLCTRTLPIASLTAKELKAHLTTVKKSEEVLLKQLEDEFPLNKLRDSEDKFATAIDTADTKADEFRARKQYLHAYQLIVKVQEIQDKKDRKLKGKIYTLDQMKNIKNELEILEAEVQKLTAEMPKGNPELHAQLTTILNMRSPQSEHVKVLRDSYIADLRQAIIKQTRAMLDDYRKKVVQYEKDFNEISEIFGISRTWKMNVQNTFKACIHDFSDDSEQFRVSGNWFHSTFKKLNDMTAEEIRDANPISKATDIGSKGLDKITNTNHLGLKTLLDNYSEYRVTLTEAKNLYKTLLSDGQFTHALKLKEKISKTEKELKNIYKKVPSKQEVLEKIPSDLREKSVYLRALIDATKRLSKLSLEEQIQSLPQTVSGLAEIREPILELLTKKTKEPLDLLDKYKQGLDDLKAKISLPQTWIDKIMKEIKKPHSKIQELIELFNSAKFNTLSVEKLKGYDKKLNNVLNDVKAIDDTYEIVASSQAAKLYMETYAKAESVANEMTQSGQAEAAKRINDTLKTVKVDLNGTFVNSAGVVKDFSVDTFKGLSRVINTQKSAILVAVRETKAMKPKGIKELLTAATTDEIKAEIRASFIAKWKAKVTDLQTAIKKLETEVMSQISTLFTEISTDKTSEAKTLPHEWSMHVVQYINAASSKAKHYLDGLPQDNGTIIGFNDRNGEGVYLLNAQGLENYEKQVKALTHERTGQLHTLENLLRLDGLKKVLTTFKTTYDASVELSKESTDESDPLADIRRTDLNSVHETQKDMVIRAFANLRSVWDGSGCIDAVRHATHVLEVANARNKDKKAISSWNGEHNRWAGLKRVIEMYTDDTKTPAENLAEWKPKIGYCNYRDGILRGPFIFRYVYEKSVTAAPRADHGHDRAVQGDEAPRERREEFSSEPENQLGIKQNIDALQAWIHGLIRLIKPEAANDPNFNLNGTPEKETIQFLREYNLKLLHENSQLDRVFESERLAGRHAAAQAVVRGDRLERKEVEGRLRDSIPNKPFNLDTYEDIANYRDRIQRLCGDIRREILERAKQDVNMPELPAVFDKMRDGTDIPRGRECPLLQWV